MKVKILIICFLGFQILSSCIERRPTPPNSAQRPATATANSSTTKSVSGKRSKYKVTGNKIDDLVTNAKMTEEQATYITKLQGDFVNVLSDHRKDDGTLPEGKAKALALELEEKIKAYLGEDKYKKYQVYRHWTVVQSRDN